MCLKFSITTIFVQWSIYIYEYMLIFFSKFWVCLGIKGHTPGAAPERRGWRRGGVQWRLPTRRAYGVEAGGGEDEGGGSQRRRRSQGQRRSVTWARAAGLWAAMSTAAVLGELERWGEQGNR